MALARSVVLQNCDRLSSGNKRVAALESYATIAPRLGRKHDSHSGMIVLWRGRQRLHDFALAWQIFSQARNVGGDAWGSTPQSQGSRHAHAAFLFIRLAPF